MSTCRAAASRVDADDAMARAAARALLLLRAAFHRLLVRVPPGALGGFRAFPLRQLALVRAHGLAHARTSAVARRVSPDDLSCARMLTTSDVTLFGARRTKASSVSSAASESPMACRVSASVFGISGSSGRRSRRTLRCSAPRRVRRCRGRARLRGGSRHPRGSAGAPCGNTSARTAGPERS